MHILCVSPDIAPYGHSPAAVLSTGLSKALRQQKHEVTLISPLYPTIDPKQLSLARRLDSIHVAMGSHHHDFNVYDGRTTSGVQTVFLENNTLFNDPYSPCADNTESNVLQFVFFSAAVSQWLEHKNDTFSLVHAHDWPTALAVILTKHRYPHLPTLYTIYDLQHQGRLPEVMLTALGLNNEPFTKDLIYGGSLNFMAAGLQYADRIVTTTTSQATAILKEPDAHGLSLALARRSTPPIGIRRGIDDSIWNPSTDRLIPAPYDASDVAGKLRCKTKLQTTYGLELRTDIPLLTVVLPPEPSSSDKLIHDMLPALLRNDIQVLIAQPDHTIDHASWEDLTTRFNDHVKIASPSESTPVNAWLAGSDFILLLPGSNSSDLHLKALRYGTLPIVPSESSLTESIVDCDPSLDTGTGFMYDTADASVLLATSQRAIGAFKDHYAFQRLQKHIMQIDHSWNKAAGYYDQMAHELTQTPPDTLS